MRNFRTRKMTGITVADSGAISFWGQLDSYISGMLAIEYGNYFNMGTGIE